MFLLSLATSIPKGGEAEASASECDAPRRGHPRLSRTPQAPPLLWRVAPATQGQRISLVQNLSMYYVFTSARWKEQGSWYRLFVFCWEEKGVSQVLAG